MKNRKMSNFAPPRIHTKEGARGLKKRQSRRFPCGSAFKVKEAQILRRMLISFLGSFEKYKCLGGQLFPIMTKPQVSLRLCFQG